MKLLLHFLISKLLPCRFRGLRLCALFRNKHSGDFFSPLSPSTVTAAAFALLTSFPAKHFTTQLSINISDLPKVCFSLGFEALELSKVRSGSLRELTYEVRVFVSVLQAC